MLDKHWDLIDGNVAHDIEVLNYSNQVNVIEALVRFLLHHAKSDGAPCHMFPAEDDLRELHRSGTLFLLAKPGAYRDEAVYVRRPGGEVVHTPPRAGDVTGWMEQFFERFAERWPDARAVEIAAFALWMLNWIHPFKNGNGRTARAFSYACICLKFGFVLPGSPTVIAQIMETRGEYQAALKIADVSFEAGKEPDLSAMIDYLEGLLIKQLESVPSRPQRRPFFTREFWLGAGTALLAAALVFGFWQGFF